MTLAAPVTRIDVEQHAARPRVGGKFLWRGDDKIYLRGVTYGTFRPNLAGEPFPEPEVVASDFTAMCASGINAVRTYTPPPRWLLDEAARRGLLVLCGLPWEQHVAFLDEPERRRQIEAGVRDSVRQLSGHPAVVAFAVGNEIPGDIVRWYGRRRVERFLSLLARAVKAEDPGALVTYVNFPTTEYLQLPFVDFACFNVYLEERDRLEAYLARLQSLAADKPLVMAEIGLDSRRNGLQLQAETLAWQVEAVFEAGCGGAFVFGWTDTWYRGGMDIEDWDFGLVDRQGRPKPALASVSAAYSSVPFSRSREWPPVSVAICSYNGARTLEDALEGATRLDYPDYEVIVVDDGSTDATAQIAGRYPVRLIRTQNQGLSAARNAAWETARGEIVAYTDDDARPDPHWLRYLVQTIERHGLAGAGGPNLAVQGDGWVAECVANAPGGPTHVLLDDITAEHIPGCNMAFRRDVLAEVGGFDPRFRAAGDDVDMCWRVQDMGYRIGFSPAAMVWHHRRNELGTYWRQQQGYGKAEALLEGKWPERYNAIGHLNWTGRIYGNGLVRALRVLPERVYHGRWGSAPFQGLYQRPAGLLELPTMPEWYLLVPPLVMLGLLGFSWQPLLWAWPLVLLALSLPVAQAVVGAAKASFSNVEGGLDRQEVRGRALVWWLHQIQPLARLSGRLRYGLAPWRRRVGAHRPLRWPRRFSLWSETWRDHGEWLESLEWQLRQGGAVVRRGGDFDDWDLEVRGGLLGGFRLALMIEEHGQGRQYARFRSSAMVPLSVLLMSIILSVLAVAAWSDGAMAAAAVLALLLAGTLLRAAVDVLSSGGALSRAIDRLRVEMGV